MKAKILVVDDEKNILEMLKKYLARKGYSVTASNTGEDGIEKAKKSKYGLAIIDVVMPGMGGIEVIKTIEKLDDKRSGRISFYPDHGNSCILSI